MLEFTLTTYSDDRPLFRALGLQEFHDIPCHSEIDCGVVELDEAWVQVKVYGAPAMFWTFIAYRPAHGRRKARYYEVTTGSGALNEYWPCVAALLESDEAAKEAGLGQLKRRRMIGVKEIGESQAKRALGQLSLFEDGPRTRPSALADAV